MLTALRVSGTWTCFPVCKSAGRGSPEAGPCGCPQLCCFSASQVSGPGTAGGEGVEGLSHICVCAKSLSRVQLFATVDYPTRLHCPWDSPGKNTGAGCHALLQGIFLNQDSNPHLLHLLPWQVGSLPPCHLRSPCPRYKEEYLGEMRGDC